MRHEESSYQDFDHRMSHKLKTRKASECSEEAGFKTILMLKSIVPLSFPQMDALRDKIFIPARWQYVLCKLRIIFFLQAFNFTLTLKL